MNSYKKWLNIAIIFFLTFSLLSPTAMAEQTPTDSENKQVLDNVASEIESIILSEQGPIFLNKGDTLQLNATVLPQNTTNDSATIEWTSDNTSIATVEAGFITAVNEGTTDIHASVGDISKKLKVVVESPSNLLDPVLSEQLQIKTGIIWSKSKDASSLTYERLLSLWQTGYVDQTVLKAKAQPNIQGETISNYTNAVLLLAVTQSNPFAYEGNNFVSKLCNSQNGEGYFSFSEPSSSNIDRKADTFVKALFALEFVGADYNQETALKHLKTVLPDIKSATNGLLLGLTVSVLANYEDDESRALREDLLDYYKNSGTYFAQGLGLYVDNLYALGENPLDEKWNIKIKDGQYISVQEAYKNLIHLNESYAFYNRLKAGDVTGQSQETVVNSHWSLIGLTALVNGKSMIQDARNQFKNLDFDFSPKTIEATNVTQPYLVKGTIFKPVFIVRDQYNTPRTATLNLQSSNSAVLEVNEKNELIPKQVGQAVITVTVEGFEDVRKVLSFKVTEDEQLSEILPKIEKAIGHLTKQDKMSSFEDAVALKTFGFEETKLAKLINVYRFNSLSKSESQDAYNAARNILSLTAAGLDPYTYDGNDYVEELHKQVANAESISADHAAQIVIALYILGETPSDKVTEALLAELVEKDGFMYIETLNSPDVARTSKVLQAVTILNNEQLITEKSEQFLNAEKKLFAFFKSNYNEGHTELNAVAILNYLSLKQQTSLEGFDVYTLANSILQNQYNNAYITNGYIPNLSGLQSESTGIGLNALSYLLTNENAYTRLKQKSITKPTTIELQLADKVKVNVPLELKGLLLDQNGNGIDTNIKWTVNGEPVNDIYTPTELGALQIRAEAQGIFVEKTIEVIDYQKIFSIKINPILEAVTDKDIELTASVKDSEGEEITDADIKWTVEGPEAVVNGSAVRFNKPGLYIITAQVDEIKAKALEVQVELNTESIQTQVAQAVEQMKQYLETKGQYDYISALAYSKVVNNPELSQKQMRSNGHLREYGNHDEKYALYYAKNILQAVAASENPKQFLTYKGQVVDLVTPLVNSQDADGHFTMTANFDKTSVATQAWSIIALDLINEPYNVELAVKDLLNGLNGPISEGSYKEQELRALALIALSKHRDVEGVDHQITTILNYLKSQQNDDGGFNYGGYTNDPFAIGTIIQGLIAVGENPYDAKWKKNGKTMIEALLKQQIKNGGFKFGDEFGPEYEFDELKSTEAAFGALADLYTKTSMFNESAQILDKLPEINHEIKPFIEITELELREDQPLLSVTVSAFDNIDGELTPTVTLNDTPVYAVGNTFKAIVKQGVNNLKISSVNSLGNTSIESIPVLFQNTNAQAVPQVTVKVAGVNGANMYEGQSIIEEGDTAYSVLVKAIGKHNIVSRPYKEGVYVVSINGLSERDYGDESGWMYRVNGVFPEVFAGEVDLKDGDTLEWLYTTNLGKDIGATLPNSPGGSNTLPAGNNPSSNSESNRGSSGGGGKNTSKPSTNDGKEESKSPVMIINQSIIETTTENIDVEVNVEDVQKALQEGSKATFTIKNNDGMKVELPKSLLLSDQFATAEKLKITVNESLVTDIPTIHVKLETLNKEGITKNIVAGKEYIKVTLPKNETTPNTVVLQLVNGEYKAVPHKIEEGEIKILTKTSGTFVVMEQAITFKDIEQTFNKEEIEYLASRHVIKGINVDEFAPNKPITRAQFAVMISRALGLQATGESTFSDTQGKWYEQDVQSLFEAGITTGKADGTFDPEAPVTRQQAAAFMARVLAYVDFQAQPSNESNFIDGNAISPEFKEYINLLNSLDIMTGKADGTFDPNGSLTRAQMAKILKRTLNIADLM